MRDTDVGKIKAGAIVPPAPDWDDGGSDTSERERRRGESAGDRRRGAEL